MRTVSIHVISRKTEDMIFLMPSCEMRVSGRCLSFFNILTHRHKEFEGSEYLSASILEQCRQGANIETLNKLFSLWRPDGKCILQQIMEEGYLG